MTVRTLLKARKRPVAGYEFKTTRKLTVSGLLMLGTMALPAAAVAQAIKINEDKLASRSAECQQLGHLILEREAPIQSAETEEVTTAINDDQPEQCMTLYEQISQEQQATGSESETKKESEEVTQEVDLSQEATIEGEAVVSVPAPEVDVEMDPPQVRVTEQPPQVDITQEPAQIELRQERPKITVEVPEIVVRVEIPAPTLYVLQEDPRVAVSAADPQVEVQQAEPRVTVRQPEPELQVDLNVEAEEGEKSAGTETETAGTDASETGSGGGEVTQEGATSGSSEPQVEIVKAEGEPQFTYDSGQPQLSVMQAEPEITVAMANEPTIEVSQAGEPKIVVETPEERQQRQQQAEGEQQAANGEQPAAEGEQSAQSGAVTVGDIKGYEVIGENGESIGTPEAVVEVNGQPNLVLESGGFLGLGETQVAVPLSRASVQDGQIRLRSLSEEEIENANNFEYDSDAELPDDAQIQFGNQ